MMLGFTGLKWFGCTVLILNGSVHPQLGTFNSVYFLLYGFYGMHLPKSLGIHFQVKQYIKG